MRVFGTSDLHLDINPLEGGRYRSKQNAVVEDRKEDVLLIAGDTAEARSFYNREYAFANEDGSKTKYNDKSRVRVDFERICAAYKYVVMIMGNHEFYHDYVDRAVMDLKTELMHIPNLVILDNETTVLEGRLRVIGSTMWTDMRKMDPQVMGECQYYMNDYRLIRYGAGVALRPAKTVEYHTNARQFIADELVKLGEDSIPTVVMVHHAPMMAHANSERAGGLVDYAYACTDMEDLILDNDTNVAVWFHGHTHDHKLTEVGATLVATAARGYDDVEFEPLLLLDLDPEEV